MESLEVFLECQECQSIWYFNRITTFSRINIIFFSVVGNVTFRCIFSGEDYLCFFWRKDIIFVTFIHTYRKYISMYFFRKVIFHFSSKEKISLFCEKRNAIFPVITKKIIFQRDFLERPSFQNIWRKNHISMYFLGADHLSFSV